MRTTAAYQKRYTQIALILIFSAIFSVAVAMGGDKAESSEVGFVSYSPLGEKAGAIVPASCESGYSHSTLDCVDFFSFTADSYSVPYNGSTVLRWRIYPEYQYAMYLCIASGDWSGSKTLPAGSENTVPITSTRTYNLTCSVTVDASPNVERTKTVIINVGNCTGPISIPWTDPVITANSTVIRKTHIDELRSWINVRRSDASLPAYTFTDAGVTANSTSIRKVHFDEMRQAISEVYTACGQAAPSWTDPVLTPSVTQIRKIHIDELRTRTETAP